MQQPGKSRRCASYRSGEAETTAPYLFAHHPAGQPALQGRNGDHAGRGADIHRPGQRRQLQLAGLWRSEEHTSELQSLMRISYAVFCLKKKKTTKNKTQTRTSSNRKTNTHRIRD